MSLDFGGDKPRCYQPDQAIPTYCPEAFTINPDTEYLIEIKRDLTVEGGGMIGGGGTMVSGGSISANSSSSSSYYGRSSSESGGYSSLKGSSSSGGGGYGSSSASGGFSSSGGYSESGGITQIYPQRVNLKLRVSKYFFKSFLCYLFVINVAFVVVVSHAIEVNFDFLQFPIYSIL